MDLYLLDHLLKDRFTPQMKILDAGCGEGRNILYFLQQGYDVYGVDQNPEAIRLLQFIVKSNWPTYPYQQFSVQDIGTLSWDEPTFDLIISSAVLHFAEHHTHFWAMLDAMYQSLKVGGYLFCRMASNVGMGQLTEAPGEGRFHLPDGSIRYLLTAEIVDQLKKQYALEFVEPLKSVVVDGQRSMAALLLRKC